MALKPQWKSAMVSTRWLAQVAVSARPRRKGVMMCWRRHHFTALPQAVSSTSEHSQCHGSATGVEQYFRKHPWDLVSDNVKLSVIHRGLISLFLNPSMWPLLSSP